MLELHAPKKRTRISLTPLIDVVFILLLFFMLSSVFTRWQELPIAKPSVASPDAPDAVVQLIVSATGEVRVQHETLRRRYLLDDAALFAAMRDIEAANARVAFLVTPTQQTPIQMIVTTMDTLYAQGFTAASLTPSVPPEGDAP